MIIEGKNAVYEALKAGTTIERLCIQKGTGGMDRVVDEARRANVKVVFSEKQYMAKLSPTGKHQGVLAIATDFKYADFDEMVAEAKSPKLFVVLDGIEDPHNLGAVIRVADCAGASGIIIPKYRASGVTDTVVKVSAGAAAHVKVSKVTNVNEAIKKLQQQNVVVVAADMGGRAMYDCKMDGDLAIVIGGEGQGVHALTKKLCDASVSIPQFGQVNSLNASVAAGVVLYEAVRQRRGK